MISILTSLALASLQDLERDIEAGAYGRIVALTVEQGGQVVYAHQFRPGSHRKGAARDADPARHDIRSAAKSITALAVGLAVDDGKLALDQEVLPGIQVVDLLAMRSALDCDDGDRRSPGQEEKMYRQRSWRSFVEALPSRPHGGFSYCTAGVFYLGQIVQDAVGEPFDQYVQRRLFDPLDIRDVRWRRSRSDEVQAGGQLEIRAEDATKLGRLVLHGGRWEDEQVVSRAWVAEMLTPRHENGPTGYGLLWWRWPVRTSNGPVESWSMQGNGGNVVALVAGHDAVVTVQTANYNRKGAREQAFEIVARAVAELSRPPGPSVTATPASPGAAPGSP